MSRIYYKSAKAAIICYGLQLSSFCPFLLSSSAFFQIDMTFAPSFKKVRFWADELRKQEPNCAIFVVGTKCLFFFMSRFLMSFLSTNTNKQTGDMVADGSTPRAVRKEELRSFAMDMELDESHFWETSAKTGANINDLFEAVALEYNGPEASDPSVVTPGEGNGSDSTASSGGCAC